MKDKIPEECLKTHENGHSCPICLHADPTVIKAGKWKRQHTFYPKDSDNWFFGCESCQKENDERWEEIWSEYYYNIM